MIDEKLVCKCIEKYTSKVPAYEEENPEWYVWLDIDKQHFRMFQPCETADNADWMRRQLGIALSRIVAKDSFQDEASGD